MLQFLDGLTNHGRPRVSAVAADDVDPDALAAAVRAVDVTARAELAGVAPPLSLPVALWALRLLEAGCRFLVYREYDEAAVTDGLSQPCPQPPGPAVCYSADLFLRHLPDLVRLARGLAEGDPLVARLVDVGRRWPLSSVGVPQITADDELDLAPFADDPALLRLYADRIIARGDVGRLRSPVAKAAVRAAVGDYAEDLALPLAASRVGDRPDAGRPPHGP